MLENRRALHKWTDNEQGCCLGSRHLTGDLKQRWRRLGSKQATTNAATKPPTINETIIRLGLLYPSNVTHKVNTLLYHYCVAACCSSVDPLCVKNVICQCYPSSPCHLSLFHELIY
jgi:hypothetical protein